MKTQFGLGAILFLVACGAQEQPLQLGASTQAIRATASEGGDVLLGADLLITGVDGRAIPCEEADVTFRVEVSRNGEEGPYQLIEDAQVHRACSSPSQGQLALVLDNSRSLRDELGMLQDAAQSVVDTVIGNGGKLSLTRVSTNARTTVPLTDDALMATQGVDDLFITNGWTSLYDGIRMGSETLAAGSVSVDGAFDNAGQFCNLGDQRGVLVFTDSAENNSAHQSHYSEEYPGDGIDSTLQDVLELNIGGATTPIYTVGLGDEADHEALSSMAARTGGRHVALDSPNDIESVLSMIAEYGSSAHRMCTQLPDHLCGSLDVRIHHSYLADGELMEGSTLQHIELPCDARASGRVATILLSLDATNLGSQGVFALAAQAVNWVSPVDAPRVLFVLDDFHHGEFDHDTQMVHDLLQAAGYNTSFMEEPPAGLEPTDMAGYDVVWFSNPGHPMDDRRSYHSLLEFSRSGGGVVLQGDDTSRGHGQGFELEELIRLRYEDNGTRYCGENIDNGRGESYTVSFADSEHPILQNLSGSFLYGDDIDTTSVLPPDEGGSVEVLAWATVAGKEDCAQKPVIVAHTPAQAE